MKSVLDVRRRPPSSRPSAAAAAAVVPALSLPPFRVAAAPPSPPSPSLPPLAQLPPGIGNTISGPPPSLLTIFALAVLTAPLANCRRRRLDTPQEALQHAKRNLQSQRTKLALTLAIPRDHHLAVTHHSGFTPARARLFRSHQAKAVDLNFNLLKRNYPAVLHTATGGPER